MRLLITSMFVLVLTACGKTGDLYLPGDDAADDPGGRTGDISGEAPAGTGDSLLNNGSETQD